jgi:hypothetical protein
VAGGEHQAGINPGFPSTLTVSILLLLAELERGDAQVRQGERCLGCISLGPAADEPPVCALDLLAHVQPGVVEIDQLPGEPQQLPLRRPSTRTRT